MTARVLIRPGATPEAVENLREEAEAFGFEVREQQRCGRLPVTARPDFAARLARALAEKERDKLSLRATARKLGVGVATLSRLLRSGQ